MLFVYSCAELQASQYSCTWGGYASYTSACGKFLNALCVYSGMNWGQISPDKIESKRFKLASIQVQIDKHSPIYYACCLARWNTRWWNDPPTFLRITLRSYVKPQVWLRLFTPINFSHFLKFHCLGTQIISTYFEVVVLDGRFDIVPCVPKINTLSELHKKLSSRFITIPVHFFFFFKHRYSCRKYRRSILETAVQEINEENVASPNHIEGMVQSPLPADLQLHLQITLFVRTMRVTRSPRYAPRGYYWGWRMQKTPTSNRTRKAYYTETMITSQEAA